MTTPPLDREVLLLVRHGSAEEDHRLGDAARGLEREGRVAFRRHALRLASMVTLKVIYTSPLVRAVQTAEILAEACGVTEVVVEAGLQLASGPGRVLSLAGSLGPGHALVGHNPSLEEAVQQLTGAFGMELRKGAAVALRFAAAQPSFAWSLAIDRPVRTAPGA